MSKGKPDMVCPEEVDAARLEAVLTDEQTPQRLREQFERCRCELPWDGIMSNEQTNSGA